MDINIYTMQHNINKAYLVNKGKIKNIRLQLNVQTICVLKLWTISWF